MKKSVKIRAILLIILLSGVWAVPHAGAEQQKPNFLLILVDDLGYMDLECYGSDFYRTPNMDKLASQGLRFTQAYAACPVCSPTRASILTGKYPARLHLTDWIPGHKRKNTKLLVPDWQQALLESETTIGELLKNEGYRTAWFGKWHLRGGTCRDHGFDAGEQDWDLNRKKNEEDPKGVFELTDEAIEFMNKSGDKPFFIGLSHYSVHTPVHFNSDVKKEYEKRVKSGARQKDAGYAAMLEALDDSVGKLLKGLDDSGKADQTVVVFFSDNGGLIGPTNNEPLRAGKGTLYEGGTRVPMIVRLPNGKYAGETSDAVVCSIDLLPTFLEMAGGSTLPDNVDGVSLVAHILTGESVQRDALYWHYPHYHKGMPAGSIVKGDYKLIEYFEDGEVELYNLAEDPGEKKDLTKTRAGKVKELMKDLTDWRKSVDAQMMETNPDYSKKKKK